MFIFYLSCFGSLRPLRHMVVAPDGAEMLLLRF
jgi:hypothetical protein